jgi:hypothetical protein
MSGSLVPSGSRVVPGTGQREWFRGSHPLRGGNRNRFGDRRALTTALSRNHDAQRRGSSKPSARGPKPPVPTLGITYSSSAAPTHVTPRSLVASTTTTLEGIDRLHAEPRFSPQITHDPNGYSTRTNRDGRRAVLDDGDRTRDEQCFTKAQVPGLEPGSAGPAIPRRYRESAPPAPSVVRRLQHEERTDRAEHVAARRFHHEQSERHDRESHERTHPNRERPRNVRDDGLHHEATVARFTPDDARVGLKLESASGRHLARASALPLSPPNHHNRHADYKGGPAGCERGEAQFPVGVPRSESGNERPAARQAEEQDDHAERDEQQAGHRASLPAPRTPHDDGQHDRDQHRAAVEDEATDAPVVRQPDGSAPGQHKGDEDEQHAPTARGLPRVHPGSLPHRRAA